MYLPGGLHKSNILQLGNVAHRKAVELIDEEIQRTIKELLVGMRKKYRGE
jgi:hypothetical protein